MSGITNTCFRQLIREENPAALGLVVTEFISVEGMTRGNEQSLRMMSYAEMERPVSIQIFGHDIARMADAAKMCEDAGADIVDINSGCPVPKVVKKGGGCELMRQPEHLAKILEAIVGRVNIPVTLKIRAGWDNNNRNAVEVARLAEQTGISMLAVHGRSRQDLYRGEADWKIIADVCAAVKIPVVGSGDVVDAHSAVTALQSGVAGLMIGRGALSNPWIFREICAELRGEVSPRMADAEVARVIERYAELLLATISERGAIGRLKQLASQVTRRVRGSAPVRKALCTSSDVTQFLSILREWRESLSAANSYSSRISQPAISEVSSASISAAEVTPESFDIAFDNANA